MNKLFELTFNIVFLQLNIVKILRCSQYSEEDSFLTSYSLSVSEFLQTRLYFAVWGYQLKSVSTPEQCGFC